MSEPGRLRAEVGERRASVSHRSQQREQRIECGPLFSLCSPVQNRAPMTAEKTVTLRADRRRSIVPALSPRLSALRAQSGRRSSDLRLQQHVQSLKRVGSDSSDGGLFIPAVRVFDFDRHEFRCGLTESQHQRACQLSAIFMRHWRPLLFRSIHTTARHPAAFPILRPAAARHRRRIINCNRSLATHRPQKGRRHHRQTQTENQPSDDQRSNCAGGMEHLSNYTLVRDTQRGDSNKSQTAARDRCTRSH